MQVLIPPIPHQVLGIVGGMLFGFKFGSFLNWFGRTLGATIAFLLSKRYGRPFVQKRVSKKTFAKFENIVDKGRFLIILIYILPLLPDDEISYILGLSDMSPGTFLFIIALGSISGSAFTAGLGSSVVQIQKSPKIFVVAGVALFIAFFVAAKLVRDIQKKI